MVEFILEILIREDGSYAITFLAVGESNIESVSAVICEADVKNDLSSVNLITSFFEDHFEDRQEQQSLSNANRVVEFLSIADLERIIVNQIHHLKNVITHLTADELVDLDRCGWKTDEPDVYIYRSESLENIIALGLCG
jgi:hypothetical protein